MASECPKSATQGWVAALGLAAFLVSLAIIRLDRPFGDNVVHSALFNIAVTAGAIFLVDLIWTKVHLRLSTGIDPTFDQPSWERTLVKFAGLLGSLGVVAFCYWLLPEYRGKFYDRYYQMLGIVLPSNPTPSRGKGVPALLPRRRSGAMTNESLEGTVFPNSFI